MRAWRGIFMGPHSSSRLRSMCHGAAASGSSSCAFRHVKYGFGQSQKSRTLLANVCRRRTTKVQGIMGMSDS
jgi:hypothetical protein